MPLISHDSLIDIEQAFGNFFCHGSKHNQLNRKSFFPRINLSDDGNYYKIVTALPGIKKDEFEINLEDGILTISATTSNSKDTGKKGDIIVQHQSFSGQFFRSFNLGKDVHESDINADYNNGILTITAPKVKSIMPEKLKIEVK